jgi:hypothetical protein
MINNWLKQMREAWRKGSRDADLVALWPAIRERAKDFDAAKQAFRMHAYCDPAWSDISKDEIDAMLEARR